MIINCYGLPVKHTWVHSGARGLGRLKKITLKRIHEVGDDVLGLVGGAEIIGNFPFRDETGIGLACYTFILSISKGKYKENFQ